MSKQYHFPLVIGFLLLTASSGAGQINTVPQSAGACAGTVHT